MTTFPVVDPITGEVLALDEADRLEVAELTARQLVDAHRDLEVLRAQLRAAQDRLALLLEVGDAVAVGGGWAVTVKPGAPARRAINRHALQVHAEALEPEGLAPREQVQLVYPTVSQLTTTRARQAMARLGLTPEAFLLAGEPGEPQVVVVTPEDG